MAAAGLPTYEEAVSGGHWLDLVAPYVAVRDYARLCRVSRRFHGQFAPRLWKDPLQSLRRLGRADLDGYSAFVARQAACARAATRQLAASLDFRGLAALDAEPWFPSGVDSLSLSLRRLAGLFPAARCLVLDGLADYDPAHLAGLPSSSPSPPPPADGSAPAPLLLSLAGCRQPLPSAFLDAPRWRLLVYLDLSYLPGSLRPLFRPGQPAFHGALPNLRILKLRGRGVDDALLAQLAVLAADQPLWSLDLGHNAVSDAGVGHLVRRCFGRGPPPAASFEVEGRLAPAVAGIDVPELAYIAESPWSASASHPARYLADAPGYGDGTGDGDDDDNDAGRPRRLAGHERLRRDDVDAVRDAVAGAAGEPAPDWHGLLHDDDDSRDGGVLGVVARRPSPGLTHLHLSGNPGVSVAGIDRLFRTTQGRLEHFDCAAPSLPLPPPPSWPPPAFSLTGPLGRGHLFRPVVAANLRSLRIHHALVTHVPSITRPGRASAAPAGATLAADACYAETVLRARADAAFPGQAFAPDHNPRLQSLVLTGLPRRSAGPLRDRLLQLLLRAYEQQEAIRLARRGAVGAGGSTAHHRRAPAMLRGLRHIRLEFAPPATADDDDGSDWGGGGDGSFADLDAAALLEDATADTFSFFAGETWSAPTAAPAATETGPAVPAAEQQQPAAPPTRRLPQDPRPAAALATDDSDSVRDVVVVWDPARARTVSVPVAVWVGPGPRSAAPSPAVAAYMQNVAHPALRTRIQPASPGQVRAGVPAGACIYSAAWDAIVWTGLAGDDDHPKTRQPLPPMHDVVEALRVFRAETRAAYAAHCQGRTADADEAGDGPDARPWTLPPHRHWTGTLEVVLQGG